MLHWTQSHAITKCQDSERLTATLFLGDHNNYHSLQYAHVVIVMYVHLYPLLGEWSNTPLKYMSSQYIHVHACVHLVQICCS